MPFVHAEFGFCEPAVVQEFPEFFGLIEHELHIAGVPVPGDEVGDYIDLFTFIEDLFAEVEIHPGERGAADFEFGEFRFEPFADDGEEFCELIVIAAPHLSAQVRFIPDFPVFHVFVFETIRPAFCVVTDDRRQDFGVFFGIFGHVGVVMSFRTGAACGGVFDTGSHTVEHAHIAAVRQFDDIICRLEVIVLRVGGIQVHQREDEVGIHHTLSAVPESPVMGSGSPEIHFAEFVIELDETA